MIIFKPDSKIKFMNKRYHAFIFSGIIIVIGIILFFVRGFNLGIDFTGGTNIEISFRENISTDDIRSALGTIGMSNATIQRVGKGVNKFFIKTILTSEDKKGKKKAKTADIERAEAEAYEAMTRKIEEALKTETERNLDKTKKDLNNIPEAEVVELLVKGGITKDKADESAARIIAFKTEAETGLIGSFDELRKLGLTDRVIKAVEDNSYLGRFTFLSVEMVGPNVGHDLRQKATLAAVWALIGMLIYIGFRFRFIFGFSAVITLLHDVLVTLAFILAFHIEVSLQVVAAILTIVGYSINDTIVVFDRVRDNLKLMKRRDAEDILDASINQTLSRTILTSGTTMLAVIALFFFGGEVIRSFSFTLMIGIFFGTYSSIFQSCAWLRIWQNSFLGTKKT